MEEAVLGCRSSYRPQAGKIDSAVRGGREEEAVIVAFRRYTLLPLDENLLWVRTFDTIEELRTALVEFANRYNETWLVARHGIVPQPSCEPINAGLIRTQQPN
jgi:hypothetical protein